MKNSTLLLGCLAALPALAAGDMFGKMDANHDGRLSAKEHAAGARAMFVAMDADHDGRVTAAEMTAAQSKVGDGQSGGMGSADKIKVVDRNADGMLSAAEHATGSKSMFAKMDRNRDGRLSRGEFIAGHKQLMAKK